MRNYFDNSVKRAPKVETFSSISCQAGPEWETICSRFEAEFEAERRKPYACKDCKNCSRSSSHCNLKGATVICGLQTPAVRLPELA